MKGQRFQDWSGGAKLLLNSEIAAEGGERMYWQNGTVLVCASCQHGADRKREITDFVL